MKKITFCLIMFSLIFSCKKTDTTDTTPDYSGTYSGTISGTCSNGLIQTPYNTATDVIVAKSGSNYVLRNFDTGDTPIQLNSNSNGFTIPSYSFTNSNGLKATNSGSGNFNSLSLTLTGTESYSDGSRCTYSFLGVKK